MARRWLSERVAQGGPAFFLCLLGALSSGCYEPRKGATLSDGEDESRCATCHGDPDREGDYLTRSAPPSDLLSNTDEQYPGVGAHARHVVGSSTHGPVACSECHVVPETVDAPGHADDAAPAEVRLGSIARTGGRTPVYDHAEQRCGDSYCHGGADAVWTLPKSEEETCGTCHGLPPPFPHPQEGVCSACHSQVIDEDGEFLRPELHVNGTVEYDPPSCATCHGDEDSAAPPRDLAGNVERQFVGVGAHRVHVVGTAQSRAVACEECHVVPPSIEDPAHADGLPAEVHFSEVATAMMRAPSWDHETVTCADTWCHGPSPAAMQTSPEWTSESPLACSGCHGSPPPAPHPQMQQCDICHADVVDEDGAIIAPERHVDGRIDVLVPSDCTACHGGENPAPPQDTQGNVATTFSGVGAHQTHVLGTETSRPVPCTECHDVPVDTIEGGHTDSLLPAELAFSGVATQYGAPIEYDGATCSGSYCHGAVFFDDRPSGGTNTVPNWTTVDGTEAECGSCHGLPPPLGHPQYNDCQSCHLNVQPDNVSFFNPLLHVNGQTETYLP